MFESWEARLVALIVVGCLLGGSFVAAGTLAPAPEVGDYPRAESYTTDPGAYVGERVLVLGVVADTDPVTVAADDGEGGTANVVVDGVEGRVRPGSSIAVFGVLEESGSVSALRSATFPPDRVTYMYAVSVLAALLTLGSLVRNWRFDVETVAFEPREEPLDPASWVRDGGGDRRE